MSDLEQRYQRDTKCEKLKICKNNIHGYFVEVRSNIQLPSDVFIYHQSLKDKTRYKTKELRELERKINQAESRIIQYELSIYNKFCNQITKQYYISLIRSSHSLAELDVTVGLSYLAIQNNYVKPQLTESKELEIIGGRHPVLDYKLNQKNSIRQFQMNDLTLNTPPNSIIIYYFIII